MGKCADRKWTTSKLKPSTGGEIDDGVIKFDREGAGGSLTGHHEKTGGLIIGTCTEVTGGECTAATPCHITFRRRAKEGNKFFEFRYDSDFVRDDQVGKYVTVRGTYTKTEVGGVDALDTPNVLAESGEWIGERPIS